MSEIYFSQQTPLLSSPTEVVDAVVNLAEVLPRYTTREESLQGAFTVAITFPETVTVKYSPEDMDKVDLEAMLEKLEQCVVSLLPIPPLGVMAMTEPAVY